jgi:hypothetical protein
MWGGCEQEKQKKRLHALQPAMSPLRGKAVDAGQRQPDSQAARRAVLLSQGLHLQKSEMQDRYDFAR